MDLREAFTRCDDEFLKFERIENPRHRRPDVCAFILLDEALPPEKAHDMVSSAEHDQIWLDVDCEKLAEVATDDLIVALTRCGVFYDSEVDSLSMWV